MNNIGNLTLIEGKNSDNGHKGNSSLGSKSYVKKKKSYEQSSSKVTRNVAEKYETFDNLSGESGESDLSDNYYLWDYIFCFLIFILIIVIFYKKKYKN